MRVSIGEIGECERRGFGVEGSLDRDGVVRGEEFDDARVFRG